MASKVDQSRACAEGDIAGHDINNTTINNFTAPQAAKVIEQLLQKLHAEMEQDQKVHDTIERLQRFHRQRSHDGVNGLEAKLQAGNREAEYLDAIEMKEMFAKLLEEWSLYASAQQIFAYLLARAEQQFRSIILPQLHELDIISVNKLMTEFIVEPTVNECGASVFEVDHNVAMGMIYWLAEQCFVRWHK